MNRRVRKYILWICLFMFGGGIYVLNAGYPNIISSLPQMETPVAPQDTLTRFPVAKTVPETYEDIGKDYPADLRNPENVKTNVEYDIRTGHYVVRTRIGEMEISTPLVLTPEEYQDYSLQQSLRSYYRQRNEEEFQKEINEEFNLTDIQFDLGPAERIFGPGGVRVRTQGTADITMGLKTNKTKDPSLPERARSRTFFNFDESVQLNVQAKVGSKVGFDMNYNTETSFDFDSKKLKLAYQGEEDEIIKNIEAGNVSMTTNNSLISGGAALFGMKADLQFGKLRVNTLFAQQESESKTINSKRGVQTTPFEITVDQYDEYRHFFLAHYFYENYDRAMSTLPYINSAITINRVEVWITNKRGNFDQARNIVAFSDLGERTPSNPAFVQPTGNVNIPHNGANNLYANMLTQAGVRDKSQANSVLSGLLEGGTDFEVVGNARRLNESEYILNKQLGYISLRTQLQPDEVLAVAFEINYNGQAYQVGEFSSDNVDTNNTTANLYVKLLKGVTLAPGMPFWELMMKNVYSLGAYSVQEDKFKLDILYQSDTTGTYLNYLQEGNIKEEILIRVMNLDRLTKQRQPHPDGFFDFVEGYTVHSETGRIYFPVVEPFGRHLRNKIGNDAIADKYAYEELYDSTLTVARQIAEKNKFIFRGEYKAASSGELDLGASNVAPGSVVVTSGGTVLTENVDYTVDYTSGRVMILNENLSNNDIQVRLENQSAYSMQRKTMLGLDLNYQFNRDFSLGATVMHMSEMPLTVKTSMGDESVKNTLWGLNTSYKKESQLLTNLLDKLPLLNLSKPSQISFNAEFAHLIAGHYENKYTGGYSYMDDFESTQSGFSLQNPYSWQISSTPYQDGGNPLFPEASLVDDIEYGKNRALIAWYYIDGIFNRPNASNINGITPDERSDHYARAIPVSELYPNRDLGSNDVSILPVLNVAYYPNERGPYNLDIDNLNPDGTLAFPEKRWGGIMRRIEQSDFEAANVEYIEFWLMDPFLKEGTDTNGGDLYFNLGEVSEDILKDGKAFFENGLPVDGDNSASKVSYTNWGKVPEISNTGYAFDNTAGARALQDVGLNGLSSVEEREYGFYKDFCDRLPLVLSPEAMAQMQDPENKASFLNDPAGDNYIYYRDDYYERKGAGILERYKRYNGTEGNSQEASGRYNMASKTLPDVEDINQDNNLNENEKYFEYRISLRKDDLRVGHNHIVDMRDTTVNLANKTQERVKWYLFRVPIKKYDRTVGAIRDFKTIRFMRMYMTDFTKDVVLRFGSFELVRGDWRTYEQQLWKEVPPIENGTLVVSSINFEENNDRRPVNYQIPPDVSRMITPGQPQVRQENEQALSLKVTRLAPQDARAVYKNTFFDLRQYKRMQMFTHAEAFIGDDTGLQNGDLSVFIRLGSDYKNNYYEYEVPLTLTPEGDYKAETPRNQEAVWPLSNKLNFRLEVLTNLKMERNKKRRAGEQGIDYHLEYSTLDPDNNLNRISIVGNPSLSEVKTIMIGVRNNASGVRSGEIWVNELRLTDFNEEGGWAANANLNVALSDLGTVSASGRIETAGFGALDQSLMERRMEDFKQYSVSTNIQLGKFFPEKAKVNIPFYYAYSKETIDPKYNPLDQDIKLKEALDAVETKAEKDSIRKFAQEMTTTKSIAFNNVKVDVRSKNPMPYDPANFSLGYSFSERNHRNPETEYETTKDYQANFAYNYTPYIQPFRPFQKIQKNNGYTKYIKQLAINYLPNNISFQTSMNRNYYEIQLKDLSNSGLKINPSFSQHWTWDRAFSIRWNLTNNLNFSFTSGTNARIEEPYVQVNKELNPDQYQLWKDSVKRSIRDLGTPLKYDQRFQASLTLPLQYIPVLDWINSSVNYTATYNWDRGETVVDSLEIGNTIRNQRQIDLQGNFNFQSLYNKSSFLKRVSQKFQPKTANSAAARRQEAEKARKAAKVELEITLNPDSATLVNHKLLSDKVLMTAKTLDGKNYPIKYKALNFSQATILTKDTVALKVTVRPGQKPTINTVALNIAEYSARFLMMIRRANLQYTVSDGMMLPGFRPEIGGMFGQRGGGTLAPGLGFAFGDVRRSYIDEAMDRGWLLRDTSNINHAMINRSKNLIIRLNLEPITGLKIDLNATRTTTENSEIQFMYEGMPELKGGSFNMTTIAISSAFGGSGNAKNNYKSSAFNKFIGNRDIIRTRLMNKYGGKTYPDAGFLAGSAQAGQQFNPELDGGVSRNSADVLIPAFLAAYTGKNANSVSLSAFPSLAAMLPNWRITYDGMMQIPFFKKKFKSFVLSHQYRANYTVGTFSSYMNWVDAGDGLGFIRSIQTQNPLPSSPYEISAVAISEGFNPLLGADATLLNNMTLRAMYNTTRNLNLNISSYQLVEALNNEVVVGIGYRVTEFNKILRRKPSQNFSNDLNVKVDFSYRKQLSLIRRIEEQTTQATSGTVAKTLMFSADYGVSRALTLRAFYDLQINEPLISKNAFPTSNSNFGVSIQFSLAQ